MSRAVVLRETLCHHVGEKKIYATLVWNRWYLPLESAYGKEIRRYRREKIPIGQVMLLQSDGDAILMMRMISKLWKRIRELKLKHVFIAIDPSDVPRFEVIKFRKMPWSMRQWDLADYANVVVMVLDVERAKRLKRKSLRKHFSENLVLSERVAYIMMDKENLLRHRRHAHDTQIAYGCSEEYSMWVTLAAILRSCGMYVNLTSLWVGMSRAKWSL
jgi:hypothetical protein